MIIYWRVLVVVMLTVISAACSADNPPLADKDQTMLLNSDQKVRIDQEGGASFPAIHLPLSDFLSNETRRVIQADTAFDMNAYSQDCPPENPLEVAKENLAAWRDCRAAAFRASALYKTLTALYHDVDVTELTLGGVRVEVFMPKTGIAAENKNRVLINIHGGSFIYGSRIFSVLESLPVASIGRHKVISIDYSLYPESRYPTFINEVIAVYQQLLQTYSADSIGIFGCSAGGIATMQVTATLLDRGLPLPGGIGVFGGASGINKAGDSALWFLLEGETVAGMAKRRAMLRQAAGKQQVYAMFLDAAVTDPRFDPLNDKQVLAAFPPTLLISSTRDYNLSQVAYTHSALVKQGVDARLHIWEGLEHCFFSTSPRIPESRDVNRVVVEFFNKYLAP